MSILYKINCDDNVAVALEPIKKGAVIHDIEIQDDIPFGHKVLLADLKKGDKIIKYGNPIGSLKCDACAGSHIHEHNLKTDLNEIKTYDFSKNENLYQYQNTDLCFDGYVREDGRTAVRNEIWIIPTVGCVNNTVRALEKAAAKMNFDECDGVFAYTHPYGCSQMGCDQENTRKILASLINHQNAGGVLVVSLGCENTNIKELKKYLGKINEKRVKFLVLQDSEDEMEDGIKFLKELYSYVKTFRRQKLSADNLAVGFKCGGSDAFSGITANALCGKLTDRLVSFGAKAVLTEVPEMFGAEHILMKRAENKQVFDAISAMINAFKKYFADHNQECYENPSPGNHDGGITTLEEKSLGCIQKGGNAVVTDVLGYGEHVRKKGLTLLTGPGNDIVSTTNLTCAGADIILFTTGRGTPLGAPVPTVKISSNSELYRRKKNWIDFNAGDLIGDNDIETTVDSLLSEILEIASGRKTKNEMNHYREIAIFKDGVIM